MTTAEAIETAKRVLARPRIMDTDETKLARWIVEAIGDLVPCGVEPFECDEKLAWVDRYRESLRDQIQLGATFAVVEKPSRKKGWSVKDPDHVPKGSRVMLTRGPEEIHPSIKGVSETFGLPRATQRTGTVRYRYFRGGGYVVQLDDSDHPGSISVTVGRDDFVYPIPDGLLAFDPRRKRKP